jgi:hypothetical protein
LFRQASANHAGVSNPREPGSGPWVTFTVALMAVKIHVTLHGEKRL